MSSRINLNDSVSEKYEFTIGGLDFDLKYPTLTDMEPIGKLLEERETASPERQKEIDAQTSDMMYAMITPVGHTTAIKDVIKTQPFPVVKAFNRMLKEQFSAE